MQKVKKVPLRKCLGCNESKPKKELIRIVKSAENVVKVDLSGKASGRGCYICNDANCFQQAIKAKRIQNALETNINEEVIQSLMELINKNAR